MQYYRVFDNSFCINVENGNPASLVQEHDNYYSPDKNEDGALFEVVSEPYVENLRAYGYHYIKRKFINVKSTFTGNIYRVLYNKYSIY